jgi:hypothetical protein
MSQQMSNKYSIVVLWLSIKDNGRKKIYYYYYILRYSLIKYTQYRHLDSLAKGILD